MMTTKTRRMEIDLDTHEVKTMRLYGKRNSVYCERCRSAVDAFTPEQIAELLNSTVPDVFRFIEADEVHTVRTAGAQPLICGNPKLSKL